MTFRLILCLLFIPLQWLSAEASISVDKVKIDQIKILNPQELLIESSASLSIASVEYKIAEKEIIFNFKEKIKINRIPTYLGMKIKPKKSRLKIFYQQEALPRFEMSNSPLGLKISLNQAVFSEQTADIAKMNDDILETVVKDTITKVRPDTLNQILFIINNQNDNSSTDNNESLAEILPEPSYLLLEFSRKVNYSLVQISVDQYQIQVDQSKLLGKHLEMPYLAPQSFIGITSVQAKNSKNGIIVTIKTDSGYGLKSYPDPKGIKLITSEARYD